MLNAFPSTQGYSGGMPRLQVLQSVAAQEAAADFALRIRNTSMRQEFDLGFEGRLRKLLFV